jgi:hypothetical protein
VRARNTTHTHNKNNGEDDAGMRAAQCGPVASLILGGPHDGVGGWVVSEDEGDARRHVAWSELCSDGPLGGGLFFYARTEKRDGMHVRRETTEGAP